MKKSLIWLVVIIMAATVLVGFSMAGCKDTAAVEDVAPADDVAEVAEVADDAEVAPVVEEIFKIGVLAANFDDKWMSYMHAGIEAYAVEIADIAEVTMVDAANDAATQIQQAEDFIAQGVDALVLVPINTVEASPIVDMCIDAGIPLISVNRRLLRQELATVYVGSDSLVAGELEMGQLAELSGGEGKVVIIMGESNHEAAIARTEGFVNIMAGYPDMEEVARDTCNWNRDEAQTLMENWLQTGLEFDIVACNNDEGAIGAILGMQSQGVDPVPYFIGGVDATPDALDYINQGLLDCSVFQDAAGQGAGGLQAAVDVLQGKDVSDIVWIPYELVTPADYETYLNKYK